MQYTITLTNLFFRTFIHLSIFYTTNILGRLCIARLFCDMHIIIKDIKNVQSLIKECRIPKKPKEISIRNTSFKLNNVNGNASKI